MARIKSLAEIAAKFVRRAATSTNEYRKGVSAVTDWQENTLAAEDNYEAGITAAIADKRFGKGVGETSNDEWRKKAETKGLRPYLLPQASIQYLSTDK